MEKLRILFLCPQPLWPTNTGARLRNFHLANGLAATCHVDVLQVAHAKDAPVKEELGRFGKVITALRETSYTPTKIVRGLTGPTPLTVLNYHSGEVAAKVQETLETGHYDAVHMESIHMHSYMDVIRRLPQPPQVVLDWHNIESELMRRYAHNSGSLPRKMVAARTASLLQKLEQRALEAVASHTVVSEREREKLLARGAKVPVHVIPNGVDCGSFRSLAAWSAGRRTILFVGSMDYHANSDAAIWFAQHIWPALSAEFPDLAFEIVGRKPTPAVEKLASNRIRVTGTVDDVRPYYEKALAVVVPLRVGGGTRLKILEAMAAGVPAISTKLGAEGLAVEDGRHILLAEDSAGFRRAIQKLTTEPGFADQLWRNARALVEAEYDWVALGQKLAAVHLSLKGQVLI